MSSSSPAATSAMELDSVELGALQKAALRRQHCQQSLPKIVFAIYVICAAVISVLCLTVWRSSLASPASSMTFEAQASSVFETQATCVNSNDNLCSSASGTWCCPSSESCGSSFGSCNANVGLIVGIIIAVWVGPLAVYLLIIAIVRCSQVGRFNGLANSGRFQSWVIVSGCFQMSIDSSSGDAQFNQDAFSLMNGYGGCGDECIMHCIGIWCFGCCYPCCMCCVSAGRNQTKVSTLQSALMSRGYNTNVQFLSSVIPACCNSVFIGLVNRQQTSVMVVTTGVNGAQVYAQPVLYAQPGPGGAVQYVQQPVYGGQPQQVAYAQPQYAPQFAPQQMYGQPQAYAPGASVAAAPAPAYTAVATSDVLSTAPAAAASASAQPPEVVKPQA